MAFMVIWVYPITAITLYQLPSGNSLEPSLNQRLNSVTLEFEWCHLMINPWRDGSIGKIVGPSDGEFPGVSPYKSHSDQ